MKILIERFSVVLAVLMMASAAQAGFPGAVELYSQDYEGVTPPALPANWSQSWQSVNAETVNVGDNEQKLYDGMLYYTAREFGVPGSDAEKFTMEFDVTDLAGAGNLGMHAFIMLDDPGGANQRSMMVRYNGYESDPYKVMVQLWNTPGGSPEYYRELGPAPTYEFGTGRYVIDVDIPNRLVRLDAPSGPSAGRYEYTWDFDSGDEPIDLTDWFSGGYIGWAGTGTTDVHASRYDNLYVEGVPAAASYLLGDANLDTVVSADDYASVQANFGNTGAAGGGLPGDANHDGLVSADDYASVQANFGNTSGAMSAVPEPATLELLAIGLIAVLRRRSK